MKKTIAAFRLNESSIKGKVKGQIRAGPATFTEHYFTKVKIKIPKPDG